MNLSQRVLHVTVDLFEKSAKLSAAVAHTTGINALLVQAAWSASGVPAKYADAARYADVMHPVAQELYQRGAAACRTGIDAWSIDKLTEEIATVGNWYGEQCIEVGMPLVTAMLKPAVA